MEGEDAGKERRKCTTALIVISFDLSRGHEGSPGKAKGVPLRVVGATPEVAGRGRHGPVGQRSTDRGRGSVPERSAGERGERDTRRLTDRRETSV